LAIPLFFSDFQRASTVRKDETQGYPGGMTEISRGSKRSADPRNADLFSRIPEGMPEASTSFSGIPLGCYNFAVPIRGSALALRPTANFCHPSGMAPLVDAGFVR